eukprot:1264150-Prymnesium_polylepis.1
MLEGIPHSLLLSNSNDEMLVLVPAWPPYRPLIESVPFSTELVLDRSDKKWFNELEHPCARAPRLPASTPNARTPRAQLTSPPRCRARPSTPPSTNRPPQTTRTPCTCPSPSSTRRRSRRRSTCCFCATSTGSTRPSCATSTRSAPTLRSRWRRPTCYASRRARRTRPTCTPTRVRAASRSRWSCSTRRSSCRGTSRERWPTVRRHVIAM